MNVNIIRKNFRFPLKVRDSHSMIYFLILCFVLIFFISTFCVVYFEKLKMQSLVNVLLWASKLKIEFLRVFSYCWTLKLFCGRLSICHFNYWPATPHLCFLHLPLTSAVQSRNVFDVYLKSVLTLSSDHIIVI